MKETVILEEIRKIRDKDAQECGYDVHRLFGKLREETENFSRQGWEVVSPVGQKPIRQTT
jgi:hypothetical protein